MDEWFLCSNDPTTVLIGWVWSWVPWRCNGPTNIVCYDGCTTSLREASAEATVAATGVGPKANIDGVLGGGDGGRKTGATHMCKQRRRSGWTIIDSHIVPGAVAMVFNVQVGKVEEDTVVGIHTDDPGTVRIVGIAAGIQRRMDLP